MDRRGILVVCTANICRSPIAERLYAEYAVRQAPDVELHVSSAGTHARPGHAAASGMQRVAVGWGLDLSYHRSRRGEADLVRQQALVITMEDRHRSVVSRLTPGVGQRTFTITELAALCDQTPAVTEGGLAAQVARWHEARARLALDAPDVDDPYGGPDEGYDTCAWQLADLVARTAPVLVAAARTTADQPPAADA